MKHPLIAAFAAALAAILFMVQGFWPVSDEMTPNKNTVALILDTDLGVYPAVLRRGATKAAMTFGAELTIVALSETQTPYQQVSFVRNQLMSGADAILLVPAEERVVDEAARLCEKKGAKLMLVDACEACRGSLPYVGTDHAASGMEATRTILKMATGPKLLVLGRSDPVSAERLAGIRAFSTGTGAQVVACVRESTQMKPRDQWVHEMIQENPDAGAILCLDGAIAESAARALKANDLKTVLAGFDLDQAHVGCLRDGSVRFTVLREPFAVGYEAVRRATLLLEGKAPPVEHIPTSVILCEDALKVENIPAVFQMIQ